MRTVTTTEFRDELSDYLNSIVTTDSPLVIRRFGRPLVIVTPYTKAATENYDKFYGFLKDEESGIDFENRVRRSKKEKAYVNLLKKGGK